MAKILRRWYLSTRVLPLAAAAVGLKYILHTLDWEVISLNPLFSGLLAATVFLIGFLISGVLSDFKESEKLPGELAVSLEALFDEGMLVRMRKGPSQGAAFQQEVHGLTRAIREWLLGQMEFSVLMAKLTKLNDHFLVFEELTAPPYIARLKNEQTALRRVLTRIRTIRDTSFVASGYTIAELMSALLILGFLIARIDPFYESLFFVGLITFMFTYMLRLIKDLDNPFEYDSNGQGTDEVSIAPLNQAEERMRAWLSNAETTGSA